MHDSDACRQFDPSRPATDAPTADSLASASPATDPGLTLTNGPMTDDELRFLDAIIDAERETRLSKSQATAEPLMFFGIPAAVSLVAMGFVTAGLVVCAATIAFRLLIAWCFRPGRAARRLQADKATRQKFTVSGQITEKYHQIANRAGRYWIAVNNRPFAIDVGAYTRIEPGDDVRLSLSAAEEIVLSVVVMDPFERALQTTRAVVLSGTPSTVGPREWAPPEDLG